ncbi:MAG: GNAT family N-acetyltransferase [Brevundimonas sp.]|nr:MAG: GNAT family N-acetyltransferase [Brevundimonas sp.]
MNHAIVAATDALVAEIEVWLDAEEALYEAANEKWLGAPFDRPKPPRGFRVNWDTVKESWHDKRAPLDVLIAEGKALGFLSGTDILEIHPDHRGRGLGVLLSDFMLRRAVNEGYSVLEIEIAPATAEPFWLREGFALLDQSIHFRNGLHAYKLLTKSFCLGDGPRVDVEIAFYDEATVRYKHEPFVIFVGEGERLSDGGIQLPQRIHGYSPKLRDNTENHIRIVVEDQEIYFDRSKYGAAHGTSRDPHGNHFIDRIEMAMLKVPDHGHAG